MGSKYISRRAPSKVLSVIISAFCVLFAIFTSVSAVSKFLFLNRQFYVSVLTGDEYVNDIYAEIKTDIKYQSAVYVIPESVPMKSITKEKVREDCAKYAEHIYNAFITGKTEPLDVKPDTDKMLADIEEYLASGESSGMVNSESAKTVVVPMYSEIYSNCINAVSFGTVIELVHNSISNRFVDLFVSGFYYFFAALIACFAAKFALSSRSSIKRFYALFSTGFISSAFVFAPISAIKQYDFPARLALGYSPAKSFLDGILYTALNRSFTVSAVLLAAFAAGMFVCAIIRSFGRYRIIRTHGLTEKEKN